ncbi:MAG TPA: beta-ketoacyl-[acyl-carrier-protein] synthase family protein [Steroidobacteraceae bacterium]
MTKYRVAVTGLGVAAPLGHSVAELFTNLTAGRSAIQVLPAPLSDVMHARIGAVVEFDGRAHFSTPRLRMLDRVSQLALMAAQRAVADARIDFAAQSPDRCGVFVGTGMAGAATTDEGYRLLYGEQSDRIPPYTVLGAMTNAAAAWVGMEYGITGPNLTYSTACSSSAVALGEAARRVQSGETEVMLAGGAEAPLTPGVLHAWGAMRTLATPDEREPSASCRPFSRNRSGLVLAEGAAFVVLEQWQRAIARGACIHAELSGYGLSTDVVHITRPTPEGQARAMRAALLSARRQADAIDYVNAHGTATLQNDAVETSALKQVFGARVHEVPISSTKSMHGHLLGAAGALEFIIAVASLERGTVPPTMHLDAPDPACDLDYVSEGARTGLSLRAAMSNSFAFGGTNAVLIAEKAD